MSHFARKLQPSTRWRLDFETYNFTYVGVAQCVHVATTFGKIRDSCTVVSAFAVPHSVETNFQPVFFSAVAHFATS